jgi:hypothetical protein
MLIAILKPSLLASPNRAWTHFGAFLHKIVNPIVLMILFFLLITPYAVVMRFFRKDPLGLARKPTADSYWQKRTIRSQNMKYQF